MRNVQLGNGNLKINEYEQGLKWFKALKSLLILFLKNKEKKK